MRDCTLVGKYVHHSTGTLTDFIYSRSMLIQSKKDRMDVNISVRNSKDNAYNTKVILSFSPNINYVKVEVRFLALLCLHQFSVSGLRFV